jgi:predicted deacetylase
MSTESHDKMIEAFINYFEAQTIFDETLSRSAGRRARYWLSRIRKEALIRREEIQVVRKQLTEIREPRVGRPLKATTDKIKSQIRANMNKQSDK